ncbi:Alpha/beta hydrolase fold-1 [Collybia nuda]|uniref:Alpha/beta hydrolase fold-1 n=1 Tax=Collybia nuda TaxID=64659 RepID=A0A9P5YCT1_9AGAR|nr:Alpha/beta hydrolase fold-1 [Collybia nuda]
MSEVNNILLVKPYTFDVEGSRLKLTAKQYTSEACDVNGLTLLFAHCIGSHKEQWEPTILRIIQLQAQEEKCNRIREAWSFDWQSHGDAAVLNEKILETLDNAVITEEWASALESVVKSPLLHNHRMVAIGHSAGASTVMLAMKGFLPQQSPYKAVFLVEPTMLSPEVYDAEARKLYDYVSSTKEHTLNRRDVWESKEIALEWLGSRMPWKAWDPRVLKLYVEHGLILVESSNGKVATLKCSKRLEGITYPHFTAVVEATKLFHERCHTLPIHVIFGMKTDYVPAHIQESLVDTSRGRIPASVTRVPGAGHQIVQEQPDALASAICSNLHFSPPQSRSRL